MNMIGGIIVGPNKSGKSLMAERAIEAACAQPLYIGTLPRTAASLERIAVHQARRDGRWTLVEDIGAQDADFRTLRRHLAAADGFLLDGLSSLMWNQVVRAGMGKSELAAFSARLTELLCARAYRASRVVDCELPFPQRGQDYWFNVLVAKVQREMAAHCHALIRTGHGATLQTERNHHA